MKGHVCGKCSARVNAFCWLINALICCCREALPDPVWSELASPVRPQLQVATILAHSDIHFSQLSVGVFSPSQVRGFMSSICVLSVCLSVCLCEMASVLAEQLHCSNHCPQAHHNVQRKRTKAIWLHLFKMLKTFLHTTDHVCDTYINVYREMIE